MHGGSHEFESRQFRHLALRNSDNQRELELKAQSGENMEYFDEEHFDTHSIEELYQLVEGHIGVVTHDGVPDMKSLAQCLMENSRGVAREYLKNAGNEECKTEYSENNVEYLLWSLGILCSAWAAEIFRHKALDGHCYTHEKPCRKGSELHAQLHRDLVESLQHLVNLLNQMSAQIVKS